MTLELFTKLLAWSSVLHLLVLLIWLAFFALAHDWMYRLHSRWFKITEEHFNAIHYAGMAFYKTAIFLFFLGPYLVLRFIQ